MATIPELELFLCYFNAGNVSLFFPATTTFYNTPAWPWWGSHISAACSTAILHSKSRQWNLTLLLFWNLLTVKTSPRGHLAANRTISEFSWQPLWPTISSFIKVLFFFFYFIFFPITINATSVRDTETINMPKLYESTLLSWRSSPMHLQAADFEKLLRAEQLEFRCLQ